jgi:FlgD Ig-like domain
MRRALPQPISFARFALIAVALLFAGVGAASRARAASVDDESINDPAARVHAIKQVQRALLQQGARAHIAQARAEQAWKRWLKKHPDPKKPGSHARRAPESEEGSLPVDALARASSRTQPAAGQQSLSVPANVRVNNPAGDLAGAGQAEQAIAAIGNNILVAWNDGQGFNNGNDVQNYAYSTDGGVTFIQPSSVSLGIPRPAGASGFKWSSDPVVTVNEKTGEFWYCGLCDSGGTAFSGVGMVKATFPGGNAAPVWSTPRIGRMVDANNFFIDKEWMVADSSSGNLYLTYTLFTASEDSIEFRRSTDNGATWGPILICSADSAAGYVQGSRPAVGPNGEVYVTFEQIGITTAYDHMCMRKSVDHGVSFTSNVLVDNHFANFGTGAPGFNRQSGITFPSIAVDRTFGPNRGRVYVTWNEGVDWYDDPLGGGGNKTEVEANNTAATANVFTPGQKLRGRIANSTDVDYFSFAATQGTTYIFWCDSLNTNLAYTMRVFCSDQATTLALSGTDSSSPGQQGFIVWTAPSTATYYFRMGFNGLGSNAGYRVETGVNGANTGERARDQRDVFVTSSDNGTTWSTPTRANDDSGFYDDWLPEVSVGADGMPYVIWFDWRDAIANCGGSSNIYASRSKDGGATWAANQVVTSANSSWTTVTSNIAPNQGDYNHIYSDGRFVHPAFADGRSGNADVWTSSIDTGQDMLTCPNDTSVTTGSTLPLTFSFANRNPLFSNDYTATLTDDDSWTAGTPQPVTLAAATSMSLNYNVPVPSPSMPANNFTLTVTNAKGTSKIQCHVHVGVSGTLGVGPQGWAFELRNAVPNPASASARIDFTLPRAGDVKLVIYSVSGERVRTLASGSHNAGPNSVLWDGRDDHGRGVAAGAYFYRLDALGQTATRRLVLLP